MMSEPISRIVKANCSRGHTHRISRKAALMLVDELHVYKWTADNEISWRGEDHLIIQEASDRILRGDE